MGNLRQNGIRHHYTSRRRAFITRRPWLTDTSVARPFITDTATRQTGTERD